MDKLKIIKTVVFILTFLLISGTILVLNKLYHAKDIALNQVQAQIDINLLSREYINQITPANNKVYVHIKGLPEQEKLIIIHPDNQTTTINFKFQ